ncbi:MAG: C39 family peptidase [Gammaproteobacteria bacterium]|nr:C39 family peptidase [Gammaproteobacteria bacterium]
MCRLIGLALLAFLLPTLGLTRETQPVHSLLELRQANVILQQFDLSCGAAALATILNYQHGDPVSEREIATRMMSRAEYLDDPMLVRVRQGFSLLDLQRIVDDRGYDGVGLGQLTLEHLVTRAPMIVPINIHGYQHFVVFKGVLGNRVLLADPAFGNRTLLRSAFEEAWIDFAEVGQVGFVVRRKDGLIPPNQLAPEPSDFFTLF